MNVKLGIVPVAWGVEMTMEGRVRFLARSALVAMAYGLAYAVLREVSQSSISRINWVPIATFRFICLLFLPIRYWPALLVGEAISIGYQNYRCLELFGLPWLLVASVPRIVLVAPIVIMLRKRFQAFERLVSLNIDSLLLCMFIASLLVGLHDMLVYSLVKQLAPGEQPIALWLYGARRVMGNYLAILTVVPLTLLIAMGLRQAIVVKGFRLMDSLDVLSGVHWKAVGMLLVIITLLVTLGYVVGESMHILALCGIVAAMTTAAWRYGWQSAAVVGVMAHIGVIVLMPTRDDSLTLLAQCMIAALMTCALLLGARTTASRSLAQSVQLAEQRAAQTQQLARSELFAMERARLHYAAVLDEVVDNMFKEVIRLICEVPHGASHREQVAAYYQDFEALRQQHLRLTGGLSPRSWDPFDGEEQALVQALAPLDVRCRVLEPRLATDPQALPLELHPVLHRLKCEAVAYLLKHAPSDLLHMQSAVHLQGGGCVAEINLASVGAPIALDSTAYEELLSSLGVSYADEQRMRLQAQLYGGDVQVQEDAGQLSILVQLRG